MAPAIPCGNNQYLIYKFNWGIFYGETIPYGLLQDHSAVL
jgi:hypothetical protein